MVEKYASYFAWAFSKESAFNAAFKALSRMLLSLYPGIYSLTGVKTISEVTIAVIITKASANPAITFQGVRNAENLSSKVASLITTSLYLFLSLRINLLRSFGSFFAIAPNRAVNI